MIENLLKHKTKANSNIVKELIEIIKSFDIKSEKELKNLEDENFKINGKILNIKERVNYILSVTNSSFDYEFLTFDEIQIYKQYKQNNMKSKTKEEKIINIIKLYNLAKRELLFPYFAYNLIIENKLWPTWTN